MNNWWILGLALAPDWWAKKKRKSLRMDLNLVSLASRICPQTYIWGVTEHSLLTPFGVLNWYMQPSTPTDFAGRHYNNNVVIRRTWNCLHVHAQLSSLQNKSLDVPICPHTQFKFLLNTSLHVAIQLQLLLNTSVYVATLLQYLRNTSLHVYSYTASVPSEHTSLHVAIYTSSVRPEQKSACSYTSSVRPEQKSACCYTSSVRPEQIFLNRTILKFCSATIYLCLENKIWVFHMITMWEKGFLLTSFHH